MHRLLPLRPVLLVVSLAVASVAWAQPGQFNLGDPLNGDGRSDIREFVGQPVLLAWYSTGSYGMGAAARAASMQKKFGSKGLVVVLVDRGGGGPGRAAKSHAFVLSRYPGTKMWSAPAIAAGSRKGDIMLIGVDGSVVLDDVNRKLGSKTPKVIASELKKMRAGWGDDSTARKVRAMAFGKGKLGDAAELTAAAGGTNDMVAAAGQDVERRYRALVKCLRRALARGRITDAQSRLASLAGAVDGHAPWMKEVAVIRDEIRAVEKPAKKLEKTYCKYRKALWKGKADARLAKRVARFAASCAATPIGRDAARLRALAKALAGS